MADTDSEKKENDTRVSPKSVCQSFIPQQWRKTKCKLCFHDIMDHTKNMTKQQSEELIRTSMNLEEDTLTDIKVNNNSNNNSSNNGNNNSNSNDKGNIVATTKAETPDIIEPCYSPRSNYTTSSKGSSDRLDETEGDNNKDSENEEEEPSRRRNAKGKIFPSPFGYEQQDSIDVEEGSSSPRTIKRRTRSYYKRDSNLLQFSAMMRSSNSSLCSFTSEYTDGYSDYDYDLRSITDDTDDYTEVNDVIDELENIRPELRARVQNERRISRSKILDLERELEGQQDHYRASEVAKERQILASLREIEGLKLELSSVKAHEHILALKSRLELEGKASTIDDLQQQVESLQQQLTIQTPSHDFAEVQQDTFNRNLDQKNKRIMRLEEENTAYQEKLRLAEDLQQYDRELLEFLRKQLTSLENDLVSARDNNSILEDNLKIMEVTRTDYVKEQEKNGKLTKELESIRQKVKRRDRHIEDLEDDNVKLQQLKTELESQLSKRDFKMKKMERRVSELQSEVTKCNKEIADLTGEKKTFEQVRKLTDLKLKDLQGTSADGSTEVENGKNIFIHTLEERLRHSESRVKEVQLAHDALLKELRELCENLNTVEKENEEYKESVKEWEVKCRKMKDDCKHKEKKNEWLQRRLHKCEQEKKRAINRQNDAEIKLAQHQEQYFNSDLNLKETESIDETDARMLKLKLQSTEAKLRMIEGNKGYLEEKVSTLERKVKEKELEITRLHDSMERDSGAPSQDYDRFDVLERENMMLQNKLDEITLENMEQKQLVAELQENNTHLDATIKNLNEKLETCTHRLKDLENANHILGNEAFMRSQCFTGNTNNERENESFNELRNQNQVLQDKVQKYNDLESDVKNLNGKLTKQKDNLLWYSEENENLKLKIIKLTQNVQSLEGSKKEFEKSIQKLQVTNHDLDKEVLRLEEKLVIFRDLFGKDSKLSSSLRRRSYQSDEERDEERMFKNALAPLIKEIKEKDNQIKTLKEAMEEKNSQIESLTSEIDRLDQNIAAQITEKIRNLHFSGDSSGENEHSECEAFTENSNRNSSNCHSSNVSRSNSIKLRTGSMSRSNSIKINNINSNHNSSNYSSTSTSNNVSRSNSIKIKSVSRSNSIKIKTNNVEQSGRISPEILMKNENDNNSTINENSAETTNNNEVETTTSKRNSSSVDEQGLTVTTDVFYGILREKKEMLEQKDREYYREKSVETTDDSTTNENTNTNTQTNFYSSSSSSRNRYSDSDSPTEIYTAIENALLDHYEENRPSPSLPSLAYNSDSKMCDKDMYEQLAELECMVNIKYKSPQVSPKQEYESNGTEGAQEANNEEENGPSTNENEELLECSGSSGGSRKSGELDERDSCNSEKLKEIIRLKGDGKSREGMDEVYYLDRDSEITLSEKGLDLSGLDDLLAEVNRRGNDYQEQVVLKKQKLAERRSLPSTSSSTPTTPSKSAASAKTVMPSIRPTKRQIIRLKELNRSASFESTTGFFNRSRSSNSLSTSTTADSPSSSNVPSSNAAGSSNTSSNVFTNSQISGEPETLFSDPVPNYSEPFRRPNLDVNKFLNSSYSRFYRSRK